MYKRKCPIEIILMDCDMPVMNGFRATEYILKFAEKEKKAIELEVDNH
jgi:CheY-like chemotaxis protein